MNPIKGRCAAAPTACTASAGSSLLANATDGSGYTKALVSLPAGVPAGAAGAWLRVALPEAARVETVSVRAFGSEPLQVVLIRVSN